MCCVEEERVWPKKKKKNKEVFPAKANPKENPSERATVVSEHDEYSPLLPLATLTETRKLEQCTLLGAVGSKLSETNSLKVSTTLVSKISATLAIVTMFCRFNPNRFASFFFFFCFVFIFRFDFVVRVSISNGICISSRAWIFLVGLPYLQSQ